MPGNLFLLSVARNFNLVPLCYPVYCLYGSLIFYMYGILLQLFL